MIQEANWLEVNDHEDSVVINSDQGIVHITKFGINDWQIDIETESGAGTYGSVDSKKDALNYVFEKAGIIENGGVKPEQVVIT